MAIPPSPTQWSRIHHCSLIITWDFGCRVARVNAGPQPKAGSCRFGSTNSTIVYPLSMTIRIPIPSLTAPYAPQCGARPAGRALPRRARRHTMALSPDGGFTRSMTRAAGTSPPRRKALSGRFCIILITALGQFRISVVLIADRGQFRTHFCHILYLILSLNHQAPTRTQIPGL